MFGVPPQLYGLIFLTTVVGYMVGSAASARLSGSRDSIFLMLIGSTLGVGSTLTMWVSTELYPDNIFTIIIPIIFFTTALGLVLPHAMATALKPFPHIAGTASALLGFIQMSLSAATSALVGLFLHDTPRPMVLAMVIISTLAMLLAIRAYRTVEA